MSRRIHSLDEVLQPVLARIEPLEPIMIPLEAVVGSFLAETLISPTSLPAQATALRAGLAVHALDLAGASLHAPVILTSRPVEVRAGDFLPIGCDALIDSRMIEPQGPFWHAAESVEPGTDTRRAGHDLAPGALIGEAGRRVTPEIVWAARQIGLEALSIRRPRIRLEGFRSPEMVWFNARLAAIGALIAPDAMSPDLTIRRNDDAPPRLALRPAETAWIDDQSGAIIIDIPARIEGMIGAWCALLLPVLGALTGAKVQSSEVSLARKLASPVGIAEIVLHHLENGVAQPLASGDFPLAAIVRANAFSLVPAGYEGFAAGAMVAVTAFDSPFL
jgi:molybdopterin molybdotransferase